VRGASRTCALSRRVVLIQRAHCEPAVGTGWLRSLWDSSTGEDDEPAVHAHVVVGCRDTSARGGHLLDATLRPTLELIVEDSPAHLRKRIDAETGLALIAP
jgi:predicted DNA-binding protein with PD1-like motif